MADNWIKAGPDGLIDAAYIWLPFTFEEDDVKLKNVECWDSNTPYKAISDCNK